MRLINYLNEAIDIESRFDLIERNCKPFLRDLSRVDYGVLYSGRQSREIFIERDVRKNRKPKDMDLKIHGWVDDWFYKKFGIRARSNSLFCTSEINVALTYGTPYIICPIGKYEIIWSPEIRDLYSMLDDEGAGLWWVAERDIDIYSIENNYEYEYGEGSTNGYFYYEGEEYHDADSKIEAAKEIRANLEEKGKYEERTFQKIYNNIEWVPDKDFEEYRDEILSELEDEKKEAFDRIKEKMNTYRTGHLKLAIKSKNEIMVHCDRYYGVNASKLDRDRFAQRFGVNI